MHYWKERIKYRLNRMGLYAVTLLKWLALGILIGGIGGVVGYGITVFLPRKYYEFNTPKKLCLSRKKGRHER